MRIVNWDEYGKLLDALHDSIRTREFDGVAAIGRGGSMIAGYLTSRLGIPGFVPLFIRHSRNLDHVEIGFNNAAHCDVSSLVGKVLVVDDLLIHGTAMRYALNLIPKTTTPQTMVMYCRKEADFKPDFVGSYLDEKEQQIMFPYDLP